MYNEAMGIKINNHNRQGTGLDRSAKRALGELQAAVAGLYDQNTPTIVVYGSYVRQQATESSDIDVLLLYPAKIEPGREIDRLSAVLADLNLGYQVLISVVPVTEEDFRHASGAFWRNVRREGIPIDAV